MPTTTPPEDGSLGDPEVSTTDYQDKINRLLAYSKEVGSEFVDLAEVAGKVTQQVFDTPGSHTWNRPAGCKYVRVDLVGGGGAGGTASYDTLLSVGSGGSSGARAVSIYDVRTIESANIVVGNGGKSFPNFEGSSATSWNDDTNSALAPRGQHGGTASTNSASETVSVGGATAISPSTGELKITGNAGSPAFGRDSIDLAATGSGGASPLGGGGPRESVLTSKPSGSIGSSGEAPGAGGSGSGLRNQPSPDGTSSIRGGHGAAGIAIITEFY